jgi:hypothetical protein
MVKENSTPADEKRAGLLLEEKRKLRSSVKGMTTRILRLCTKIVSRPLRKGRS